MKTSYWMAATLGAALAFSAHAAAQDQTRSQDRIQAKDQVKDQARNRLRDGSCGQTPGTAQRRGPSSGHRGGRGR